jgi:hypothetical protein
MPDLSGVTAPITPDSRTTGTTAVPRHRAGTSFISAALISDRLRLACRRLKVQQPLITQVSSNVWNAFCISAVLSTAMVRLKSCHDAAESDMKIYLLVMIIGSLLTAIHFTSAPKQPNRLPH